MKGLLLATAVVLGGAGLAATHAEAAPLTPAISHSSVAAATADSNIQHTYWVWRHGVRYWVGPPPGAYWWHGRHWHHRGWYHGGWRYW
jgi:hypothetical protein